ncbi:hypothetical protein B0H14DRAFT_2488175, partial [Mycena olivaceomarginata]
MPVATTNVVIRVFSGDQCDGDEGLNEPCDNRCNEFDGRHSLQVHRTGAFCLKFYEGANCKGNKQTMTIAGREPCTNVNTNDTHQEASVGCWSHGSGL